MCKYCDRIKSKHFENPKEGDLRVWWMPQFGSGAGTFYYPVNSPEEAKILLDILAQYDLFQLEHNVKPDFSNAGGLQVYEDVDGESNFDWCDWYSEDGESIDEFTEEE